MVLNALNSNNLEQLALKGLIRNFITFKIRVICELCFLVLLLSIGGRERMKFGTKVV